MIAFVLASSARKYSRVRFVAIRPSWCSQAGKYPLKLRPYPAVNSDAPFGASFLLASTGAPVT
jgi:hypothetical protein